MITVPAAWLTAADTTHAPQWLAEILPPGADPVSGAVIGGTLRRSADQFPRTTATVQIPADTVPGLAPEHLRPYGPQARLSYRASARDAWVVVAWLHVVRSRINRPEGVWELEAVDASALIMEDAITPARPAALTGTIGAVVAGLIRRTLPHAEVTVSGAAATSTVPPDWKADTDPWRCIEQLTDLAGATVDVDPQHPARFHVVPFHELAAPVDHIGVGVNITEYSVGMERTWNACAVLFRDPENRDTITRAGWWTDERPGNPLAPSRLGQHITLVRDDGQGTPTQAQADEAARVHGQRQAGRCRLLQMRSVPRPWLLPGDTITVTFSGGPVAEPHLVTAVDVPLDLTPMTVDTRNSMYLQEA